MISERIIVIDDDARIIKILKMALTEYEIVDFMDSEKAVEYFSRPRDINLVLLDVMMPKMDGLAVLEKIKRTNKNAAVIIMTAYGSKDVAIQALRNHADDFIEKPFAIETLREKIRGFLRQRFYFDRDASDREKKVERIKSFIKRNYSESSLEIIAEEMCLSPKYISRMFREQTGESYRDFHLKARMDAAKHLLESTSFNIDEISYKLGYQNPESFMRMFKRLERVTPTQYRRKFKEGRQKVCSKAD